MYGFVTSKIFREMGALAKTRIYAELLSKESANKSDGAISEEAAPASLKTPELKPKDSPFIEAISVIEAISDQDIIRTLKVTAGNLRAAELRGARAARTAFLQALQNSGRTK